LIHRVLLFCGLGLTLARGTEKDVPGGPNLPAPPVPMSGAHSGTVTIGVTFDSAGKVASCRVEKSCGSEELDEETADFIKDHWHTTTYAGNTIHVPICYQPQSLPFGTPDVPNLLLPGEPTVSLRLWVSFDSEGYVKSFGILEMSKDRAVDQRIMNWIFTHWRTKDYRHQTVDLKLYFEPPASDPNAKVSAK
jgi:TonB family protein